MRSDLALIERFDPVLVREIGRRRRPLVLAFAVIALIALAAAQAWPSTYVASTTILVRQRSIIRPSAYTSTAGVISSKATCSGAR